MPFFVSCLIVLAGGYGFLVFFAWLSADSMIFQPRPTSYATLPGLITISAADGTSIAMVHLPNAAATHTVLYFHGNAEDLGDLHDHFEALRQHGYAVLGVDYRSYGLSAGSPNEPNVYADAAMAFRYLVDQLGVPPQRIIIYGSSLGGGAAVELATRGPVAGLVLHSCFVSAFRVVTGIPLVPGDRFKNLAKIGRVRCPVLVMHGDEDGTIPFSHGKKLFAAAPAPKRFLRVEGAGHNNLVEVAGPRYWDALKEFAGELNTRSKI